MPLSAKERMARWRQKQRNDPNLHEQYKQKERERNQKRKEQGYFKSIKDMTCREQRKTRRAWRINSAEYRKRNKEVENILTPPNSPNPQELQVENRRATTMKRKAKQKRQKEKAKCYRENEKLKIKLKFQERLTNKYKKRCERMKKKLASMKTCVSGSNIKPESSFTTVTTNTYVLYKYIIGCIRQRYKRSKTNKQKRMISGLILREQILKKYGLSTLARQMLGISKRHMKKKPPKRPRIESIRINDNVKAFFERDDVSKIKADKHATITRKGIKKQIRLLTDDLKMLHEKYRSEGNKISYSLFCKLRPFWTVKPTEKDRKTCMCKIHDNIALKLQTAYTLAMINTKDVNELIKTIVCDNRNFNCMYRECSHCRSRKVPFNFNEEEGTQVNWSEWRNVRIEAEDKRITYKTVKINEQGTKQTLSEEINNEVNRACRHIFNIRHQYQSLKLLRERLTQDEICIHIDFSENYCCKYADEIQAMHFGASRRQVSLHTGVIYIDNDVVPFCTVSDCLKHGPGAIWAHLDPVLKYITKNRNFTTVHFISDGPTTQYRNKGNFFLWSTRLRTYGFLKSTWNFLEASHGKGAADGIGAAIKRAADQQVIVKKKDVTDAKVFVDLLTSGDSKIKLFEVNEESISEMEAKLPNTLQAIPNTMKLHQLVLVTPGTIAYRFVSCFCGLPEKILCECFSPNILHFNPSTDLVKANEIATSEILATASDTLVHSNHTETDRRETNGLVPVDCVEDSLIGKYCVVVYDNMPYPGIIMDVDDGEEMEVKVMCRIGPNRFFWPLVEDRLWYSRKCVITLIDEEPELVTKRHRKIPSHLWNLIVQKLDLDEQGKPSK